jgi:hypothetical protein
MSITDQSAARFGRAWLGLCLCLALHVTDEAVNDFLGVYNPAVQAIRARLPFLPFPTFTFRIWLGLLVTGICVLLALSVLAWRGKKWMVPLAYVFGIIMFVNGLGHFAGSVYMGRLMPGVYSSPLLLAGSVYLLIAARRFRKSW